MTDVVNKPGGQITVAHMMPWSSVGGVEVATLRLVAGTRDRFRHIAFCLEDAHDLRQSFEEMGIETVSYKVPVPSIRYAFRFYKESQPLARALKQRGVNIVHFADVTAALNCSLAAVLARCRLVCHVRVSYPHFSLRDRLWLSPVHLFLFVSREARQSFGLRIRDQKAAVIYDAVEPPLADGSASARSVRAELGIAPEVCIVGMVARVARQKDYPTLVDAAAMVLKRFPDTRFLIVGDNSLVPQYREHYLEVMERLESLGIADAFLFTGYRTDVSRLTSAKDLCVLCTHREGFPLSILETMAMAKPTLATAVGGIPEIVQHGVTGYLHQHGNAEELASEICTLLEDPEKRRSMGDAGAELVRTQYSPAVFAQNMTQRYYRVSGRAWRRRSPG